jgi:hypothetical protein
VLPRLSCFLILLALFSPPAVARDWLVAPDGSGDVPTIAVAIDSFSYGDRIVLMDGTFRGEGNRDLNNQEKNIVIYSQSNDPTLCIIDCQGSPGEPHDAMSFYGGG